MTSPDLLADSYRDNDDYCFTRVYGFNLNKNECRNITHTATSARCDVGCFPSIRRLYYVYFKTSVMCLCVANKFQVVMCTGSYKISHRGNVLT